MKTQNTSNTSGVYAYRVPRHAQVPFDVHLRTSQVTTSYSQAGIWNGLHPVNSVCWRSISVFLSFGSVLFCWPECNATQQTYPRADVLCFPPLIGEAHLGTGSEC